MKKIMKLINYILRILDFISLFLQTYEIFTYDSKINELFRLISTLPLGELINQKRNKK